MIKLRKTIGVDRKAGTDWPIEIVLEKDKRCKNRWYVYKLVNSVAYNLTTFKRKSDALTLYEEVSIP